MTVDLGGILWKLDFVEWVQLGNAPEVALSVELSAFQDALDPTIGHGSNSVEYGDLATTVFSFQNQLSSQIEEELGLLRGVYDFKARPVYNRLFWNFTKGEGEAAYATNYNLSDVTLDGFIAIAWFDR